MTNALPAAAWFPDPSDPARLRWWDGAQWTGHVHPPIAPAVAPPAAVVPVPTPVAEPLPDTSSGLRVPRIGLHLGTSVDVGKPNRPDGENLLRRGDHDGGRYAVATRVGRGATQVPSQVVEEQLHAGLTEQGVPEQHAARIVETQRALAGWMVRLERSRIGSRLVHEYLRRQARSVAAKGRNASMDVTFAGVRYQARGDQTGRR